MLRTIGSLRELQRRLRAGELTAVEVATSALQRIAADNPRVRAITDLSAARALEEARAIDALQRAGADLPALAGAPFVVKDMIDVEGVCCPAGLRFLAGRRAAEDAAVVRRLRAAGAVVLGVTATDSAGFAVRTPEVVHPRDPGVTVGGSSGGSAAAIAAGFAIGALGTDTGGSIRIPAACCGVAGIKPTHGLVETAGVLPLAPALDHVGPLAKRASDLGAMLGALAPRYLRQPIAAREAMPRIGELSGWVRRAAPEVRRAVARARDALQRLGARLYEVELARDPRLDWAHSVIFCREAVDAHRARIAEHGAEYPERARSVFAEGARIGVGEYRAAQQAAAEARARVAALFERVDCLLLPTLPVLAPPVNAARIRVDGAELGYTEAMVMYTSVFNLTGHPALSLPVPADEVGPGASVQLVGAHDADAALIALGARLEALLHGWPMPAERRGAARR
jgi:Asp-tRNA(Asn)/Glu-tRNA(Gln) amidotransferase A subunit family amidase